MTATKPIPADGNLPQAKRLLGDAISALIDPRPQHLAATCNNCGEQRHSAGRPWATRHEPQQEGAQ